MIQNITVIALSSILSGVRVELESSDLQQENFNIFEEGATLHKQFEAVGAHKASTANLVLHYQLLDTS